MSATTPTVWDIEDLGQAPPSVQAPYMQWLWGGECGGHVLPSCVAMVATSNYREKGMGVTGILDPVISRMLVVRLVQHLDDFCAWGMQPAATRHGPLHEHIVGFVRFRPDLLSHDGPCQDMMNQPNGRNWERASNWLYLGIGEELPVLAGCVGDGAAGELVTYVKQARSIAHIPEMVFDKPEKADMPTEPNLLYAVTAAVAYRTTAKNFVQVACYAERLNKAKLQQFGVLLLKDAVRRNEQEIVQTMEFKRLATTPLGKLIRGES